MEKTDIELNAATVGLDLAKHVFQVHAVDAAGRVVMSRALRRKDVLAFFERLPSCLIGHGSMRLGPSLGSRTGKVWP